MDAYKSLCSDNAGHASTHRATITGMEEDTWKVSKYITSDTFVTLLSVIESKKVLFFYFLNTWLRPKLQSFSRTSKRQGPEVFCTALSAGK